MTNKRITSVDDIRVGASYEIGGSIVKAAGYGIGSWLEFGEGDDAYRFPKATVHTLLVLGIPITEISSPPVPEHVEPAYEPYSVYRSTDPADEDVWVYMPGLVVDSKRWPWLRLNVSSPYWLHRDSLPARLRLIRSSTPVEDQS